jgi:small conductance mechanosensitive channel
VLKALSLSLPGLVALLPTLVTVAVASAVLWGANRLMVRRLRGPSGEQRFARQIAMLGLTLVALVVVVLTLPVSDETRGQLLGLLGLAVTAAITLSSQTFVSNAMAGLMMRSVGNMHPGDFVRIGDDFGRVTIRGLFHTEIQTPDRNLMTLPNLYLVSNPVTVVRESGTIISCNVALGYDNAHSTVEPLLLKAAEAAGLSECFVLVTSLESFTVSYRIAGFLQDVSSLLSTRSALAKAVLDELHGAGIEIMSPSFMAQRPVKDAARVVPLAVKPVAAKPTAVSGPTPEEVAFDKAEEAGRLEGLRHEIERIETEIRAAKKSGGDADDASLETKRARLQELAAKLEAEENTGHDPSED